MKLLEKAGHALMGRTSDRLELPLPIRLLCPQLSPNYMSLCVRIGKIRLRILPL